MSQIAFQPPDQMNLLGYFLRTLMERNLTTEKGRRAFGRMRGAIVVGASDMRVTLTFDGERVVIAVGASKKAAARVAGDLDTLLGVTLGRGMIGPVLRGKLRIAGNVFRLLRLLTLIKCGDPA